MEVGIFSAFIGGLLTFLAPCTLPLVPAYLGFIGGVSGKVRRETAVARPHERLFLLINALFFVLGFSVVFVGYGLVSGAFGSMLIIHRELFARVGGVLIVLFGLSLLDVFPMGKFFQNMSRPLPRWVRAGTAGGAFLLGFLFALGWSPCLGPILGSILVLAATGGHAFQGAFLLGVYSLGLGVPFIILAAIYGSAFSYIPRLSRFVPIAAWIGAWVLIVLGLLLVFGQLGSIGTFLSQFISYDHFIDHL